MKIISMKSIITSLAFSLILSCGNGTDHDPNPKITATEIGSDLEIRLPPDRDTFFKTNFFTTEDAFIILGEKSHLLDSSSKSSFKTLEYQSSYVADTLDPKSGKKGTVYFMIEQYNTVPAAHNEYKSIKTANEKHEGVKVLNELGDEAYFHSDGKNFYFVLVRKDTRMFRLKVNKVTYNTTLENFNRIVKKITDRM